LIFLLNDRFAGVVRLRCQFGLMNLKIKTLKALAARNESGFADFDGHRSALFASPLQFLGIPLKDWITPAPQAD
jgi:hypothetical protein